MLARREATLTMRGAGRVVGRCPVGDHAMNVSGYSEEDLTVFRQVLDRAVAECAMEIPVELMTRRLFNAAGNGERNPDRLLSLVLARGHF